MAVSIVLHAAAAAVISTIPLATVCDDAPTDREVYAWSLRPVSVMLVPAQPRPVRTSQQPPEAATAHPPATPVAPSENQPEEPSRLKPPANNEPSPSDPMEPAQVAAEPAEPPAALPEFPDFHPHDAPPATSADAHGAPARPAAMAAAPPPEPAGAPPAEPGSVQNLKPKPAGLSPRPPEHVEVPAGPAESPSAQPAAAVAAEVVSMPAPRYPPRSRRLGEEGLVLLEVEVLCDGRPGAVRVLQAPPYPRLVEAAIEAVRKAVFRPAAVRGAAVVSTVEVPIRFRLD